MAQPDIVDLQYHNYQKSGIVSQYVRENGLLVIPVMGPTGTAPVVVRVSAGYGFREASFEYIKKGTPPLFPSPENTPSGDVLLSAELQFPSPVPSPEGGLMYGVKGSYSYVQPSDGRAAGGKFPIDAHPFMTYIDTLGEDQREMSNPDDLTTYGQWNKNNIDTSKLTSGNIVG
jgi:hypothetical protein